MESNNTNSMTMECAIILVTEVGHTTSVYLLLLLFYRNELYNSKQSKVASMHC